MRSWSWETQNDVWVEIRVDFETNDEDAGINEGNGENHIES